MQTDAIIRVVTQSCGFEFAPSNEGMQMALAFIKMLLGSLTPEKFVEMMLALAPELNAEKVQQVFIAGCGLVSY